MNAARKRPKRSQADATEAQATPKAAQEGSNGGQIGPLYDQVIVTSSRGQHPDDPAQAAHRPFFGNYPETKAGQLAVHYVIHRQSDGTVYRARIGRKNARHRDHALVIMLLGQFEPQWPNFRPFTPEEKRAIDELLWELKDQQELAEDAPLYAEYGIPLQGVQVPLEVPVDAPAFDLRSVDDPGYVAGSYITKTVQDQSE